MAANDHAEEYPHSEGDATETSWTRLVASRTTIPEELMLGTSIPLVFNAVGGDGFA